MANVLNFTITQSCNCKTLVFKETSGNYSADNTGGWGAPNDATSDATSVVLSITPPGGTATELDLSASFPTGDTTYEYEITGADVDGIGEDADFPSGLYEFVYTVVTPNGTYTKTKQLYLWCTLSCCVDKLFASIDYDKCGCNHAQVDEALLALAYLRGISYHASIGNYNEADNIKSKLEKLCTNSIYCNNCS